MDKKWITCIFNTKCSEMIEHTIRIFACNFVFCIWLIISVLQWMERWQNIMDGVLLLGCLSVRSISKLWILWNLRHGGLYASSLLIYSEFTANICINFVWVFLILIFNRGQFEQKFIHTHVTGVEITSWLMR